MAELFMRNLTMSSKKTIALSLAAIFLSAVSVQAATHAKHATHKTSRAMHHKSTTSMAGADNSADSLNAQSLTRAQAPQ